MRIRGYAIPFAPIAADLGGGIYEQVDPGAFTAMLATTPSVQLLAVDHSQRSPLMAKVTLFADHYGLAFEASMPDDFPLLHSIVVGASQASVNFTMRRVIEEEDGVRTVVRVENAAIVIGTSDAVYGNATGVWPAYADLAKAPRHLKAMAARWGDGQTKLDCSTSGEGSLLPYCERNRSRGRKQRWGDRTANLSPFS